MERLARQIQEAQKLLQQPDAEWKARSEAMEELATAVESLGRADSKKDAVRLLMGISVISIRSRLVKDACESLYRILNVTGRDFQDLANALLPQIVNTAKNSSAAIRHPGSKLLGKISELVRYDLSLMRKIFVQLTQDKVHVLLLDQLGIILVYWSEEEVLMWESDVLEMVQRGLNDQNEKVRKAAREVLTRFSSRWSERVYEWVDMPSNQAKVLLIDEHRDSSLAQAILSKYPELAKKSDSSFQGRASFTQSRRKSPRHKREQSIEIHVSATPPPKQRERQEFLIQESSGIEVTTNPKRDEGAVSRRLFEDGNPWDDTDDQGLENSDEAFDGSQMYGFNSKLTSGATNDALALASKIGEVPSPPAAIPSRMAVARSSSASSVEEASLRHPGIRKLQESKIPKSPLNRSPSLLNKKYLESPTRSGSSPELRPSLLLRPGSFTLKSRGSSGASTPIGVANSEEEKGEFNPLSASDEYFSKPIPSTISTPTPPPQSTDNITLRPKRRTFVCHEQEDSPRENYCAVLASPELPAREAPTRPRQEETTPDAIVSSPLNEVVASITQENPFVDFKFDETDDIGHLTEGSDNDVSDNEWNRHRLNDSQSGNERGNGSTQEDQLSPSGEEIFSDEWRLDEGPRYKFDFEDEIGDHLSDGEASVIEDEHTTITKELEALDVKWHEHVTSSHREHFSVQRDCEEEQPKDEELATEMTPDSSPKDALSGLLGVRAEMTRLRAITRNEENSYELSLKERYTSTHYTSDTADAAQEHSPVKRDAQQKAKPKRMEPTYLDRLTQADHFSRSPLLAPPIREQSTESGSFDRHSRSPSPPRTVERESYEATTRNTEPESWEETNFLSLQDQLTGPSQMLEHASARFSQPEPFNFVKEPRPADDHNLRAEVHQTTPQETTQASFVAREVVGRFDAAEKLFAAKEVPSAQGYYGRPPPIEPEDYMQPKTCHERVSPTQLGAKLNPSFTNAQKDAITGEANGDDIAAKDVHARDVSKADVADMGTTLKVSAEQASKDILFKPYRPKPDFVETLKTPAPADEHDTSPLIPENVARPTPKPSTAVLDTSAPPTKLGRVSSCGITLVVFLAAIFSMVGILHGAKTVYESREYHAALKTRIDKFETSIAESHKKVLKLEEDYAVWSEYLRKLMEEDEKNALTQLEAIQIEVQKWQLDMKADLVQFRQALSVDAIEAAFATLHVNKTHQIEH